VLQGIYDLTKRSKAAESRAKPPFHTIALVSDMNKRADDRAWMRQLLIPLNLHYRPSGLVQVPQLLCVVELRIQASGCTQAYLKSEQTSAMLSWDLSVHGRFKRLWHIVALIQRTSATIQWAKHITERKIHETEENDFDGASSFGDHGILLAGCMVANEFKLIRDPEASEELQMISEERLLTEARARTSAATA
jgi:hypothetical protein